MVKYSSKDIKLVDAQAMHRKYPDTFEVPFAQELSAIRAGDFVKLIFDDKERMWVKVTEHKGDTFTGILDNVPITLRKPKFGDTIQFRNKHIASIMER